MGKLALTQPQRRALVQALRDGGEIILRGLDATPGVSGRVVHALRERGLLRWQASSSWFSDRYVLTEAGKTAAVDAMEQQGSTIEVHVGIPPEK